MPAYRSGRSAVRVGDRYQFLDKRRVSYFGPPETQFRPEPPEPAPVKPAHELLGVGDQLALLQLSRRAGAGLVATRLKQNGAFHPDMRNFRALVPHGYAVRNTHNRFHSITSAGTDTVKEIVGHHARAFGLHAYFEGSKGRFEVTGHCICGWQCHVRKGSFTQSNLRSRYDTHVYGAGALKELFAAMKPPAKAGET